MESGDTPVVTVTVEDPSTVEDRFLSEPWHACCLAQSPQRLAVASRDRRWQTTWAVARHAGRVLGVLPIQRSRSAARPADFYDPAVVAPELVSRLGHPDPDWWYVGGFKDLVSGVTVVRDLSTAARERVRQALVAEAFTAVARQGGTPVSLYVRAEELPAFRAALGTRTEAVQVTEDAVIDLPGSAIEDYLAVLPKKARYRVRREWAELADRGVRAREQPAGDVCTEAASLVVAVKQRHGTVDHPRMAEMRLREWARHGADEAVAMTLRAPAGTLVGVVFVGRFGDTVEVNELGLAPDVADRHLLYTELLVHAPMRYALRHGCRRLALGVDSIVPKALRGARVAPVWAVARRG